MLIPMKVHSETLGDEPAWVIYDTSTGALDLGLIFSVMEEANLYAVEDLSLIHI